MYTEYQLRNVRLHYPLASEASLQAALLETTGVVASRFFRRPFAGRLHVIAVFQTEANWFTRVAGAHSACAARSGVANARGFRNLSGATR